MLSQLLHTIDDFIIDRVFQPVCDKIRKNFGWSKKVPTAVMSICTSISLMPLVLLCVHVSGIMYLFAAAGLFYVLGLLWLGYRLLQNEFAEESRKILLTAAMDPSRAEKRSDREWGLIFSIILIPLFVLFPAPIPKTFMLDNPFDVFSVGLVANLCRGYFQACTDLPPGKTAFARMKERIAAFLAKPAMT